MPSPPWILEQSRATLQLGALQSTTDVGSLAAGLTKLSVDGSPLEGLLWQIKGTTTELAEAFIRGNDLVAIYQEMEDYPFRTTAYWTAEPTEEPTDAGGATCDQLSLTISVETDLLDSHPEFTVSSQLPVEEVLCVQCTATEDPVAQKIEHGAEAFAVTNDKTARRVARCLVLYRLTGGKVSLAEMVHPDDFQELEVNRLAGEVTTAKWRVFGQFLEKGVIRRARMNAVLLPRKNDIPAAAEVFQQFAESEAVLTA